MMIALSPGGACSDFYFKGKEHPRSLEARSSGGAPHKLQCLGKGWV